MNLRFRVALQESHTRNCITFDCVPYSLCRSVCRRILRRRTSSLAASEQSYEPAVSCGCTRVEHTASPGFVAEELFWCKDNKTQDMPRRYYPNLSLLPLRSQFIGKVQAFGLPLRCRISGKEAGLRSALSRAVP